MRALLLIALVGCSEHGSHPLDASMDRAPCEAAYQQALDRACSAPSDCTLVEHDDCCGTVWVGVRVASKPAALAAEATYGACFDCGARGCAHADLTETGMTAGPGQSIVATCNANRCTSIVQ